MRSSLAPAQTLPQAPSPGPVLAAGAVRGALPGTALALAAFLALAAGGCVEAAPIIESTTVLLSTADTVGPYEVQTVVSGATDHVVELRYRFADQVRFVPLVMSADQSRERFRAAIPGSPAGSRIFYYVAVLDQGERVAADPEAAGASPYSFEILDQ